MTRPRLSSPEPLDAKELREAFIGSFGEPEPQLEQLFSLLPSAEEALVDILCMATFQAMTSSLEQAVAWSLDQQEKLRYSDLNIDRRNRSGSERPDIQRMDARAWAFWHARLLSIMRSQPNRLLGLAALWDEALARDIDCQDELASERFRNAISRERNILSRLLLSCADLLPNELMAEREGACWPPGRSINLLAEALQDQLLLAKDSGDAKLPERIVREWRRRNPQAIEMWRKAIAPEATHKFLKKAVHLDLICRPAGAAEPEHIDLWLSNAPTGFLPGNASTIESTSQLKIADRRLLPPSIRNRKKLSSRIQHHLLIENHPLVTLLGIDAEVPRIGEEEASCSQSLEGMWEWALRAMLWCLQGGITGPGRSFDLQGCQLRQKRLMSAGEIHPTAGLLFELVKRASPIHLDDLPSVRRRQASEKDASTSQRIEKLSLLSRICRVLQARAPGPVSPTPQRRMLTPRSHPTDQSVGYGEYKTNNEILSTTDHHSPDESSHQLPGDSIVERLQPTHHRSDAKRSWIERAASQPSWWEAQAIWSAAEIMQEIAEGILLHERGASIELLMQHLKLEQELRILKSAISTRPPREAPTYTPEQVETMLDWARRQGVEGPPL